MPTSSCPVLARLGAPKRLPVRSSVPIYQIALLAKCSMVPVQVLQSIFTLAFDQSRSNTPEPGDVSLQIPCGTP